MLTHFIPAECIKVPLQSPGQAGVTKKMVIEELVDLLPQASDPELRASILSAVLRREGQMSTGIGNGIAIPHGSAAIEPHLIISAGVAPGPGVEFAAIDHQPVRLFFLMVAQSGERTKHLQALANIARLVKDQDVYERLLNARDADTFLATLKAAE